MRETETNLDSFEESIISDVWKIDEHGILSESWNGPTRFRIINIRPRQGYSWVDGRWTKNPVTSRPETIWPEVCPSLSKCAQKEAKQQWEMEERQIQVAHQKRKIHDIPLQEVEEFDAIVRNARKTRDSSENSNAMR